MAKCLRITFTCSGESWLSGLPEAARISKKNPEASSKSLLIPSYLSEVNLEWEREDSNLHCSGPEPDASCQLRYAPSMSCQFCLYGSHLYVPGLKDPVLRMTWRAVSVSL